jgi:hypothetical protein
MSSNDSQEQKKNNANTRVRVYRECESFLYRYRWWIVLILAVLLAWYLYTRRCDKGEGAMPAMVEEPAPALPQTGGAFGPKLGNNLNFGDPVNNINTEGRRLFGL